MNATLALTGNPNSGKTTLFNALTGARQHVGNYPGITVEKREGRLSIGDLAVTVVDLPGAYSLTPYSPDELVARAFLVDGRPDARPPKAQAWTSADARERALAAIDAAEAQDALRVSVAGRVGTALEPVFAPLGFDWRTNIALLGGFAAKEVIVSTLGTAYSLGEVDPENSAGLSAKLLSDPAWNTWTTVSLIAFVLLYAPCFVTVAVIGREIGWRWAAFSVTFNTSLAYVVSMVIHQVGSSL